LFLKELFGYVLLSYIFYGFTVSGGNIMKGKNLKEMFRNTSVKAGSILLATALVFGSSMYALDSRTSVPELVSFVDTDGSVVIEEEETPLGAPKVTTSTKTKKKTKKIKLKKASKKTYNKKGKSSTKKSTSNSKSGNTTTTTDTVVDTAVLNKFKKGSKVETRVTTTTTTVTTTVVTAAAAAPAQAKTTSTAKTSAQTTSGIVPIASAAPQVDSRVSGAFSTLGFSITVNPSVSYSGLFDARTRSITLKQLDATVYHELGHFLAFVAGNVDTSSAFQAVFAQEKDLYTAYDKAYVLSSSSEYFATSFKNYTENPSALQSSRPQTYAAIVDALSKVTNSQVSRIANVYAVVWN
jgi:hypothetical protein